MKTKEKNNYVEQLERKMLSGDRPVSGQIDLTYRCNLRCQHCFIARKNDKKELTFACMGATCVPLAATGWSTLYPSAVNNSGVVVGSGMHLGVQKGFVYDGTTYTPIVPDGWSSASLSSINDAGVVAGYGFQGGVRKGFVYDGTTYTPIVPDGWSSAFALSINSADVVAGGGSAGSVMKGFIAYPPSSTPQEQVADILDSIDAALAAGTVTGNQLSGVEKALTKAASGMDTQTVKKTCKQLNTAFDSASKQLHSKKAGVAETASEVLGQIQDVMMDPNCK